MIFKKSIILACLLCLFTGIFTPSVTVFAAPTNVREDQFDPDFQLDGSELKANGFTTEEIEAVNNYELSGVYLEDGKAFIGGVEQKEIQRGKFTWAVKAIRKVWNRLPTKVKTTIGSYVGINGFLRLIEHYTGSLENAIYSACKKVGMSSGVANFVTKTMMLFI